MNIKEFQKLLPEGVILLGYRGSIAHNMYIPQTDPNSIDDKDIMGVCIPPLDYYFGLKHFEQQEKKEGEWDSVVYELRKFIRLLVNSNPNVLSLLWLKSNFYIKKTPEGEELIKNRSLFVSKKIFHAFTGYAYGQLKKMEHASFEGYMGTKRKALVDRYGYDCKNAAHCIRLLRVGIEFLREGELHVWREDAPQLLEIKLGKWTLDQVKKEAEFLFRRAQLAHDECRFPNEPDLGAINKMVTGILTGYLLDKNNC